MMNRPVIYTLALLMLSAHADTAFAEAPIADIEGQHDALPSPSERGRLLPEAGRFGLTVGTGVPFLGIGELAIGITDDFSLGVVAGITPLVPGVGLRARGTLASNGTLTLLADVPVLYYPTSEQRGEWVLTRPMLLGDMRVGDGIHLQVGLGLFAIVNVGAPLAQLVGEVWQTARLGGVFPMSEDVSLFADAGLVFSGLALAGPDWVGGPPAVVTLGMTWML